MRWIKCEFFALFFAASTAFAAPESAPWSTSLSIGYGSFSNMFQDDGRYALLKLGFGKGIFEYKSTLFGLELGVETGNTMRLDVSREILDQLGGLPFQSRVKPIIDLLGTARIPVRDSGVSVLLKAGAALRTWQFDRCSADDRSVGDPEFQAGFAWTINKHIFTHLTGRVILGRKVTWFVDPSLDQLSISGMPNQYGILFGTTFLF